MRGSFEDLPSSFSTPRVASRRVLPLPRGASCATLAGMSPRPPPPRPAPAPHSLRDLLLLSDFARANPQRAQELLDRCADPTTERRND